MTRLRIERMRPCCEYAAEFRPERALFAVEATDFFLLAVVEWLVVAGGGSGFACTDEFAFVSVEAGLSGVGAAAFSAAFVGAAACD